MKSYFIPIVVVLCVCIIPADLLSQDDTQNWLERNNISIRKTFDGSVNEYKPATFSFFENHKSDNDFINVDLAIKFGEIELLEHTNSVLLLYPVIEWHKSSNEDNENDKLSAGINAEYYFGQSFTLKPYLLSNFAFKRNLLEDHNELRYVGQLSFIGDPEYSYLPGVTWRFKNDEVDYKGLYFPYFGYEYNEVPDLVSQGETETFSALFARLFIEYWALPRSIQLIFDGTYRGVLGDSSTIKKELPLVNLSFNYYPGKQEHISIGVTYRNGYAPDLKYAKIETTAISLNVKF
ncbi:MULTISPECIES: hypothetical protein [Aquimarina]|uniref:hypothetical protein n=1 Tax=Aquimarina TaxID=290174 RepID=UPI000D69D690|nr:MULTISPECIES: hypothetical protein [Aquimarina]